MENRDVHHTGDMGSFSGKTITITALFLLFLFLLPGINRGLWGPDEPREAGICSAMVRTGEYMIPRLNGKPFLEKPPLYYIVAASIGSLIKTDNEIPYRLASLFFGTLTLLVAFSLVSRHYGRTAGLIAAGILASSWGFFKLSRWILVDISLVFSITLCLSAYLEFRKRESFQAVIVFGLGLGTSFMAKGLIGPAIVASAVLMDTVMMKDFSIIRRLRPHLALPIMFATTVPWIVYLYAHGGWPFVREVIVVNGIMRFTGAPEGAALGHQHGMTYYLSLFPENFLPWTLLFIPALISAVRKYRDNPFLAWFAGPFILICIASTKRGIYLVPLFPAAAAITALWLCSMPKKKWELYCINAGWASALGACLLPLAGIFYGRALLGLTASIPGMIILFLVIRKRIAVPAPLHLVVVMFIGVIMSMTVFFSIMTPREDYLSFAREAIVLAQGRDIRVSGGDELFRGLIPMVTGKTCHEADLSGTLGNGIYIWRTSDNRKPPAVLHESCIKVMLEKRIGSKNAVMARVMPSRTGMLSFREDFPQSSNAREHNLILR